MYNPQKQNKPSFFERKKRRKFFCHSIITYKLVTFYYIYPFLKEKTLLFSFFLQKDIYLFTTKYYLFLYKTETSIYSTLSIYPPGHHIIDAFRKNWLLTLKKKIKTFSKITYLIRYKSYVHLQRAKKPYFVQA